MAFLMLVFLLVNLAISTSVERNFQSDEIIDYINSVQNTWKAGRNFYEGVSQDYINSLTCAHSISKQNTLEVKQYLFTENEVLPTEFDSRKQWPDCPSIHEIRDQGSCGSCWAFGAVESMSDRQCIHTNVSFHYAAEDLVACCHTYGLGCYEGFPEKAWQHWVDEGIVSGGNYNSSEGCMPYTIPSCDVIVVNDTRPPCGPTLPTPKCSNSCQSNYHVTYKKDKHYGRSAYTIKGVKHIQKEIMTNGPVEATFKMYDDFLVYKKGIYKYATGKFAGYHSMRILGWGVEKNTPYWLIANSWNADWGDHGYVKIFRGSNECEIEESVNAGLPKT